MYNAIYLIDTPMVHSENVYSVVKDHHLAILLVTSEGFWYYNDYSNILHYPLPVENFLGFIVPKFSPYKRILNWK